MLNKLRNLTKTLFAKILIILIIMSFASWGIGDLFRSQANNHVAKINNYKVTPQYLDYRTNIMVEQYKDRYRQYFSQEAEIDKNAMQIIALRAIVEEELIKSEAQYLGYKTNQMMAFSLLKKNSVFLDEQGNFDQRKLKSYITQNNLNEKNIFANISKDIINNIFDQSFSNKSFNFEKLYKLQSDFINQTRTIKLITLNSPNNLNYNINPSESELLDFYSSNKDNYLIAKNYSFELATVNCVAFRNKVIISSQEIQDQFDKNPSLYQIAEKRYVKQIFANSEEKIKALHQSLESGKDFNQVALSNNMKKKDIELGLYSEDQLYQSFAKEIFALALNSYSQPIKGPFNWHIFTVSKIHQAKQNSFTTVKKDIRKQLVNDKSCIMAKNTFTNIQKNLAETFNLKDLAQKNKLSLEKFKKVNLQEELRISNFTIDEIEQIKRQIANNQQLNRSQIITLSQDNHLIYNVSNINEARHPNIDEIKGLLTLDWQKDQQKKLHKIVAQEIQQKLSINTSSTQLKKISNNHPLKINSLTISRDSKKLPPIFNKEIFNLKLEQKSQPFYDEVNNKYLIAILENYKIVKKSKGKNFFILEQIKNNLAQNLTNSMNNSYLNFLDKKYQVEYKNQLVDNISNQNN